MRAQHHVGCDSKGAMHGLYVKRWYYLVYARMSAHHDVYLLYSTYLTHFIPIISIVVRVGLESVSMTCMIAAI